MVFSFFSRTQDLEMVTSQSVSKDATSQSCQLTDEMSTLPAFKVNACSKSGRTPLMYPGEARAMYMYKPLVSFGGRRKTGDVTGSCIGRVLGKINENHINLHGIS